VYARRLKGVAGHAETRKSKKHKVSNEWHRSLGFTSFLAPQRYPLGRITSGADMIPQRAELASIWSSKQQMQPSTATSSVLLTVNHISVSTQYIL
jgi:hypothetical protein